MFVSEERHFTDMSSNRKKIMEPWEIAWETCRRGTKIEIFACFCPSKKPLFSLFLQILPFPAKIQNKNTFIRLVSTNPIFLRPMSSKLMKEEYLKKSVTDGQIKKTTSFFARVMTSSNRMKSNFARVFPYVDVLFCRNDFLDRFIRSRDIVLKTVSSAHRPTL